MVGSYGAKGKSLGGVTSKIVAKLFNNEGSTCREIGSPIPPLGTRIILPSPIIRQSSWRRTRDIASSRFSENLEVAISRFLTSLTYSVPGSKPQQGSFHLHKLFDRARGEAHHIHSPHAISRKRLVSVLHKSAFHYPSSWACPTSLIRWDTALDIQVAYSTMTMERQIHHLQDLLPGTLPGTSDHEVLLRTRRSVPFLLTT